MPKSSSKSKKKAGSRRDAEGEEGVVSDPRFSSMYDAPVFQRQKKDQRKVKLDQRFKSVLTDKRFQVDEARYDKYGRKNSKKKSSKAELDSFYKIEDDKTEAGPEKPEASSGDEPQDEEGGQADGDNRIDILNKMARGELDDGSSSSDSSDDEEDEGEEELTAEEKNLRAREDLAKIDAPVLAEDTSRRLACQNLDWKHLKAVDILVLLKSFCPTDGEVKKVTVYPSDFGIEKMAEEEKFGPQGIWANEKNPEKVRGDGGEKEEAETDGEASHSEKEESESGSEEDGEDDDDDDEAAEAELLGLDKKTDGGEEGADTEALRNYELQTLKYYFAVAEFDRPQTANKVYEQVDGLEFETSSSSFDLRFIPDEVDFEGREVRDAAATAPSDYRAPAFVTAALQRTAVESTWDEGDTERAVKLSNFSKWREMKEDDLAVYLAPGSEGSDSSENEDNEEKAKNIRKLLLGDDDGQEDEEDDFFQEPPKGKRNPPGRTNSRGARIKKPRGGAKKDDKPSAQPSGTMMRRATEAEKHPEKGVSSDEEDGGMEMTFIPEASSSSKKASKGASKDAAISGLDQGATPWEKFLEKRKNKKKNRKEQIKAKINGTENDSGDDQVIGGDDFFVDLDTNASSRKGNTKNKGKKKSDGNQDDSTENQNLSKEQAEMDLLLMNDQMDGIDDSKDFDMRALVRKEKMKGKKLKGKRKRKEEKKGAVKGEGFQVNLKDDRFAAVLEGDSRFGIDRTDIAFKETEGMMKILKEQKKRKKRQKKSITSEAAERQSPTQTSDNKSADSSSRLNPELKYLVSKLKNKKAKQKQ